MGDYIDVLGHATWVEQYGQAHAEQTVLLLHGGISNCDDLRDVAQASLADRYRIVAFDRRGHGRTADTDRPFHYQDMADETIAVLQQVVGGPAHVVGWSDGGIVALLVALQRPELLDRVVLIGTDFHFDGVRPFGENEATGRMFDSMKEDFGHRSPDGPEHFDQMLAKATELMETEPTMTTADLAGVAAPTLVLVGDDDVIEHRHTIDLFEALPDGRLAVVPAASHMVAIEHPESVGRLIAEFLTSDDPPRTRMPSRRTS